MKKTIFEIRDDLITEETKLRIVSGILYKKSECDTNAIQIVLENLGKKTISSVTIAILTMDILGKKLDENIIKEYSNIECKSGETFGENSEIVLNNIAAESFGFQVTSVNYSDGTAWKGTEDRFVVLPPRKTLEKYYGNKKMASRFRKIMGTDCTYAPQKNREFWYCTCGKINFVEDRSCLKCGRLLETELEILDNQSVNLNKCKDENKRKQITGEYREKKPLMNKIMMIIIRCVLVMSLFLTVISLSLISGMTDAKVRRVITNMNFESMDLSFVTGSNNLAEYIVNNYNYKSESQKSEFKKYIKIILNSYNTKSYVCDNVICIKNKLLYGDNYSGIDADEFKRIIQSTGVKKGTSLEEILFSDLTPSIEKFNATLNNIDFPVPVIDILIINCIIIVAIILFIRFSNGKRYALLFSGNSFLIIGACAIIVKFILQSIVDNYYKSLIAISSLITDKLFLFGIISVVIAIVEYFAYFVIKKIAE